ncbi:MAG: HAD family hydrolase [Bacillota bacterium]|jgi:FMN phosphatase YigB (HAD superfamily)
MPKYILFDLDGTLLPMDTDYFLDQYLRLISAKFAHLVPPKLMVKQIMASSYATIGNAESGRTNEEKFMADFLPKIGREAAEMQPLFDRFYVEHFPALVEHVHPSPLARELVQAALDQGYRIVLATNPIFPLKAVEHRLAWAGVADLPWEYISCLETSHFCKPNPAYFAEVLEQIGAEASDCIHFGNDLDEDMAACKIGIPVVIVEDYLINRHQRSFQGCLYHGSLAETAKWLRQRM